eukprot:7444302-Alexandrium_andersonii.AAC.1
MSPRPCNPTRESGGAQSELEVKLGDGSSPTSSREFAAGSNVAGTGMANGRPCCSLGPSLWIPIDGTA